MRIKLNEKQYYILTIVACFFIAAIIVTGASVRVTGSGLGCPTWPKCTSDSLVPKSSESGHAFVEFANRVFTGFLSLSVIVAISASFLRQPRSKKLIWLSFGLVLGVIAQIILGGITVLVGLHPLSVAAHMIVSLLLLSCAILLTVSSKPNRTVNLKNLFSKSRHLVIMLLTYLVVVLGTVVTAAGPHAGDEKTPRLDVTITSVARIHSFSAWILLLSVLYLLIFRKDQNRNLKILLAVIVIQGAWGYAQYALDVPASMVLVHVFLATVLFVFASLYWSQAIKNQLDSQLHQDL
ncbi:MAG: COX15/CtaA family protein [Acidimicrobiia bacterium]